MHGTQHPKPSSWYHHTTKWNFPVKRVVVRQFDNAYGHALGTLFVHACMQNDLL